MYNVLIKRCNNEDFNFRVILFVLKFKLKFGYKEFNCRIFVVFGLFILNLICLNSFFVYNLLKM